LGLREIGFLDRQNLISSGEKLTLPAAIGAQFNL
jgi:hypothetical protein